MQEKIYIREAIEYHQADRHHPHTPGFPPPAEWRRRGQAASPALPVPWIRIEAVLQAALSPCCTAVNKGMTRSGFPD